ncbi:MAG: GNAT family N-acetyltransferase [Actinomycetota bacterium]|nr:GNAT family N-acetyltransferase [Actinomycetota bacterium]
MRAFADADLDAWAEMVGDAETARFVGGVQSRSDAWLRIAAYLGHWELRGYGQWAVEELATGRFVGRAGLWFPEGWPELEVGWTFSRSVWGRGYATEAGAAAVAWGRSALGLKRIASVINPANARSIAVAERLGMSFDRTTTLGNGTEVSVYAMSL